MALTTIQKRRGTAAQWVSDNPILADGEEGLESDTGKTKHGNGAARWNALPYFAGDITAGDARWPRITSLTALGGDPTSAAFLGADVDARVALDQVLLQAVTSGMSVGWLPKGRYRLSSTYNPSDQSTTHPARVLPGNMRGFTWLGGWGVIGSTISGGNKIYAGVEFAWFGAAGGVMWELDSLVGAAIIGVCFRGRGMNSNGSVMSNRAGIGLNISQRGGIVGSGLHLIERVTFNNLVVGVKFGEGQVFNDPGNCDTTTFRDCTWQDCDTAISITHNQNLVYNFEGTSGWVNCRNVFKSTTGGYINIQDLNANGCGGTDANSWMLDLAGGHYAGTHKISRGRLENECTQLLKMRSRYTEVLIEGLVEAQSNQSVTMFDVIAGQLTMIGGALTTHSASAPTFKLTGDLAGGGIPSIRLYGVRFDTATFLYEEWFGHVHNSQHSITVRDCENQNGLPIPSFSTRLESGLPVPLRARTTDATTNVPTTLLNNNDISRNDNCCQISAGAWRVRITLLALNVATDDQLLRVVREVDVSNDGTNVTMSTPDVIGTDLNPSGLIFGFAVNSGLRYIRATVRGLAGTTIDWRCEFQLIGGMGTITTG